MTQRYGILKGGSGGAGTDVAARAGVAANDTDIAALQSGLTNKADQAALDTLVAANATQAELDALQDDLSEDELFISMVREADQSITITVKNIATDVTATRTIAAPVVSLTVVDALDSTDATASLSANQGRLLRLMIAAIRRLTGAQINDRADDTNAGLVTGKLLSDRDQAQQGTLAEAITGTVEIAKAWAPKTIKEIIEALKSHDAATLYVPAEGYGIDDVVSYDGPQADSGTYKALEDIAKPAGVFDLAKWRFIGTPREYVIVDSPTDLPFDIPFLNVVNNADWTPVVNGTANFERLSTDFVNRIEGSLDVTDGAMAYTIPLSLSEGEAIYFTAETDGNPGPGNFDNLQIAATTDGDPVPGALLFDNRWHRLGKIRVKGGQLEIAHTEILPGFSFNPGDGIDNDISVILKAGAKVTTVAGLWGSDQVDPVVPVALAQFVPANPDHALASDISAKTIVDYLNTRHDSGELYDATGGYVVDQVVTYYGPLADNGTYAATEIIAAPAGAFDSTKWQRVGSSAAAATTVTARFQPNHDYFAGDPILEPNPLDDFKPYVWTADEDFRSGPDPDFDGTGFTAEDQAGDQVIGRESDITGANTTPKMFSGVSIGKAIDILKDSELINRRFRPALATQLYGIGGGKVRLSVDPTDGLTYAVREGITSVTSTEIPSQNTAEWQLLFAGAVPKAARGDILAIEFSALVARTGQVYWTADTHELIVWDTRATPESVAPRKTYAAASEPIPFVQGKWVVLSPIVSETAAAVEVFTGTVTTPKLHQPNLLKNDINFLIAQNSLLEYSGRTSSLFGTNPGFQRFAFFEGRVYEAKVGDLPDDVPPKPATPSAALQILTDINWRLVSGVLYSDYASQAVPDANFNTYAVGFPELEAGDVITFQVDRGGFLYTFSIVFTEHSVIHEHLGNAGITWRMSTNANSINLKAESGGGTQAVKAIKITR